MLLGHILVENYRAEKRVVKVKNVRYNHIGNRSTSHDIESSEEG